MLSKIIVVLAILFGLSQRSHAATNLDSLRNVVELESVADSSFLKAGISLTGNYLWVKPDSAIFFANQCLVLATEIEDSVSLAHTHSYLGLLMGQKLNYSRSFEHFEKCADLYDKLGMKESTARTLLNHGLQHELLKNFPLAIEMYTQALEISTGLEYWRNAAYCTNNLCFCYPNEDTDEIKKWILKFEEIQRKAGEEFLSADALWGYYYGKLGDWDKAAEFYEESLNHPYFNKRDYYLVQTQTDLIEAYIKTKRISSAENQISEAEGKAKSLNAPDLKLRLLDFKSQLEELKGNNQKSLFYARRARTIKDSLDDASKKQELEMLSVQFQTARHIQERNDANVLMAKSESDKTMTQIIGGIVLFVVFASLIFAFKVIAVKKKVNRVLEKQKQEIFKQRNGIVSSINYAKKIQDSMLACDTHIKSTFPDFFKVFKPKDIVSGDFYWFSELSPTKAMIAAVDCTGHGVPGAFMSLIVNNAMNTIIGERKTTCPTEILNQLNVEIVKALNQDTKSDNCLDGADVSLVVVDYENKKLQFAGASNSIMIVRNGEVREIHGDKISLGGATTRTRDKEDLFPTTTIPFLSEDNLYLYSDGFMDQLGGEMNKKLNKKRFKSLLQSVSVLPTLSQAKTEVEGFFAQWKGESNQLDDILLLGVKL